MQVLGQIVKFSKELLTLKGQVEKNTLEIKEIREDLKQLTTIILISEETPQGGVYAQDEVHNCIQQPLFLQQDKIGQNVDLPGTKRLPCIALSTSQK
jgi:hypothetical protein